MIAYATLGTNDLPRAAAFYDTLLAVIGGKRQWENERGIGFGNGAGKPSLGVMKPFDGQPASVGNGTMIALAAGSNANVDALHKKTLELGGKDEGAPGLRGPNFYMAYARDLDGNKLAFFHYN